MGNRHAQQFQLRLTNFYCVLHAIACMITIIAIDWLNNQAYFHIYRFGLTSFTASGNELYQFSRLVGMDQFWPPNVVHSDQFLDN